VNCTKMRLALALLRFPRLPSRYKREGKERVNNKEEEEGERRGGRE